jgi:hypothetical protein
MREKKQSENKSKASATEIMTPEHKDWKTFTILLWDAYFNKEKNPTDDRPYCISLGILEKYFPNVDTEATVKFFEGRSDASCDYEIMMELTELEEDYRPEDAHSLSQVIYDTCIEYICDHDGRDMEVVGVLETIKLIIFAEKMEKNDKEEESSRKVA